MRLQEKASRRFEQKYTPPGGSEVSRCQYFASNACNCKSREYIDPQETQNANATIEGIMHQEMMKTLQVMQREILGLKVQMNSNTNDATLNTSNKGKRGK